MREFPAIYMCAVQESLVDRLLLMILLQALNCTNGALVVAGGEGVGGDLNVCGSGSFGGNVTIDGNLTVNGSLFLQVAALVLPDHLLYLIPHKALHVTNGALVVAGGVGIGKDLLVCGSGIFGGNGAFGGDFNVVGDSLFQAPVTITDPTQSTSCLNGALVVVGGAGIGKNLNVCGN